MQKELTQQKTIQKQNRQQNTDVLTKTAPVMMQKENTDAEFDKILRRPRSKKKLKLYAEVDLPSLADEEIMERMRKEQSAGMADGSSWGEGAQEDNAQEDISQEDIASFLQSRQEEFIKMIQSEIREEEERIRREEEERKRREEEERKRREEEERARKNGETGVLSKCFITGCYVHFIPFAAYAGDDISWNNVIHFKQWEVPKEFQQALHLYEKCKNCNCVEIYDNRLVAIANSGEVIKIVRL